MKKTKNCSFEQFEQTINLFWLEFFK